MKLLLAHGADTRLANADDVVGPILFLASESARYITGQVIHVNGGRITP